MPETGARTDVSTRARARVAEALGLSAGAESPWFDWRRARGSGPGAASERDQDQEPGPDQEPVASHPSHAPPDAASEPAASAESDEGLPASRWFRAMGT